MEYVYIYVNNILANFSTQVWETRGEKQALCKHGGEKYRILFRTRKSNRNFIVTIKTRHGFIDILQRGKTKYRCDGRFLTQRFFESQTETSIPSQPSNFSPHVTKETSEREKYICIYTIFKKKKKEKEMDIFYVSKCHNRDCGCQTEKLNCIENRREKT